MEHNFITQVEYDEWSQKGKHLVGNQQARGCPAGGKEAELGYRCQGWLGKTLSLPAFVDYANHADLHYKRWWVDVKGVTDAKRRLIVPLEFGNLLIRNPDKYLSVLHLDWIYALVFECPNLQYEFLGWEFGYDCKNRGSVEFHRPNGEAYFVPRPYKTFIELLNLV